MGQGVSGRDFAERIAEVGSENMEEGEEEG